MPRVLHRAVRAQQPRGVQRVVDMRVPKDRNVPSPHATTSEALARLVLSEPLEDALRERMARKEQSILLLNRRGYSAFVQCASCGEVDSCPNCSISLTYHRAPERLVCHYCQHTEQPRTTCRRCGGAVLKQRGLGTQQVERLLRLGIDDWPNIRRHQRRIAQRQFLHSVLQHP